MARSGQRSAWDQQFDAFYLATRRDLVLQTFALTGDLVAAERGVREGYVAAWHHWRKLTTYDDPARWVRPHAWASAQRRHGARLWHRTRDVDADHKAVLDGLHQLPGVQRRVLLLVEVAQLPLAEAARELSLPEQAAERHLRTATAALAGSLDTDSAGLRSRLLGLAVVGDRVRLPRPATIRREGRSRRRSHTVIAAALTCLLAVVGGAVAYDPQPGRSALDAAADPGPEPSTTPPAPAPSPTGNPEPEAELPSPVDLLADEDLGIGGQRWREVRTHDNTGGDGLTTPCQQARFADPDGLSTMVREFATRRKPRRTASETVEISASGRSARSAYDTTIDWYASCPEGNVQLTDSFRLSRLGDEARVLLYEVRGQPVRYAVAIGRSGQLVTTVFVRTRGAAAPRTSQLARTLASATRALCDVTGEDCVGRVGTRRVAPPPAAGEPGLLALVDLPEVGGLADPWAGTEPVRAGGNPASTTCDRADFLRSGASPARTRTFLVPDARLPARFGLAQTTGVFDDAGAARSFLSRVRGRVAGCEDRDLATQVTGSAPLGSTGSRFDGSVYSFSTETSEDKAVDFSVGFARRGRYVTQLTFYPADRAELGSSAFATLVDRAAVRLGELEDDAGGRGR